MNSNLDGWNNVLVNQLFTEPTASQIVATPIIPSQEDDILCWRPTPNGKFNSKSAYRVCLQFSQDLGTPTPAKPDAQTVNLLNNIWKSKDIIPRVKTLAWHVLRRALPSGSRLAARSKHISGLCSRCGTQEDDAHIPFHCPFARAAWFLKPWHIRIDHISHQSSSISHTLTELLKHPHPHASLANVLTFAWCLWKSRNDHLFGRKQSFPYQIAMASTALLQDQEVEAKPKDLQVKQICNLDADRQFLAGQGFMLTQPGKIQLLQVFRTRQG